MISDQTEFCDTVIETNARNVALETGGIVALFARDSRSQIQEYALVLIIVAALAAAKRYSLEEKLSSLGIAVRRGVSQLHFSRRRCFGPVVTFLAWDLLMQAGKREGRAGMVKLKGRSPGLRHVTLEAVGSQLVLMRILVAECTLPPEPEE
jgi:hypothetical protein